MLSVMMLCHQPIYNGVNKALTKTSEKSEPRFLISGILLQQQKKLASNNYVEIINFLDKAWKLFLHL